MKLLKITPRSKAGPDAEPGDGFRRVYEDACGAAHGLDLVGERWALLVVRELMMGPKRFSQLRADLPGISANVLTQRLERLESVGVLARRKLPPPASIQVYELTAWGYEAEPIFQTLGRWAARSTHHDPSLPFSATSLMLSFRTMFDPGLARDFAARIGFRIGAESYLVTIAGGALTAERRDPDEAQVVLIGPAEAIAGAVYGGVPFETLEAQGALTLDGDRAVAERFKGLFPLPAKVA